MTAQQDIVDHRKHKRPNRTTNTRYDDKDKLFALAVYAETGCQATASKRTGIPPTTINTWLKEPDVDSTLDELRSSMRRHVAFKCAEASVLAIDAVIDRLTHGDYVVVNNELQRAPVKAKDAGYLAGIMIDRHTLLTANTAGKSTPEMLQRLANELVAKMRQVVEPKTIEQESDTHLT